MELIASQVAAYLDQLVPRRDPVLVDMEARAAQTNFPIVGPASGQLCYLLTRLTGARRVFELGSGYGYSTAWFARGVKENGGGTVNHVVWDAGLSASAREYLAAAGLADQVEYHVGEAVAALRNSAGNLDIVFNDIDKPGYPASLEVIESKLRPGGLLITDNLLWSGRILDESDQTPATRGIREFTRLVMESPKWIASIVPIRDGVLVARFSGS